MAIPKKLRYFLENKKWYLRFRYSELFLNSWLKLRKDVRRYLQDQQHVYQNMLTSLPVEQSPVIFDIGANEGFHTQLFKNLGYNVIAVEPSPRNVAILKTRFSHDPMVEIIAAAVSDKCASATFIENTTDFALGTLSEKWSDVQKQEPGAGFNKIIVETVTLDHLITKFGKPVFVKIDVEGYEETVLAGLTQAIPLISFEAILPKFLPECERCIMQLAKLSSAATFSFSTGNQTEPDDFITWQEMVQVARNSTAVTLNILCKTF